MRTQPCHDDAMQPYTRTTTHPITCSIGLRGALDRECAGWFTDLDIRLLEDGAAELSGELADQTALLGVLLRVHNLNLDILWVSTARIMGHGQCCPGCPQSEGDRT